MIQIFYQPNPFCHITKHRNWKARLLIKPSFVVSILSEKAIYKTRLSPKIEFHKFGFKLTPSVINSIFGNNRVW